MVLGPHCSWSTDGISSEGMHELGCIPVVPASCAKLIAKKVKLDIKAEPIADRPVGALACESEQSSDVDEYVHMIWPGDSDFE